MKKLVTAAAAVLLAVSVTGCGKSGPSSSDLAKKRTEIHVDSEKIPANGKLNPAIFNKLGDEYLTASRADVKNRWVDAIYKTYQGYSTHRDGNALNANLTKAAHLAKQETPETIANSVRMDSRFITKAGNQYEYIKGYFYSAVTRSPFYDLKIRGFKDNNFVEVRCSSHTDYDGTTDTCGAEIQKQLGIRLEKGDIPQLELK